MTTENGGWDQYDDFLDEASRDDRVGDHDFMVSDTREEVWPSGDPRFKVVGVLLTAGQAKCDLTWSPPPSPSVLKELGSSMDRGKKRAIANNISIAKALAQYYGKGVAQLAAGDVIRVKTVKTKETADGKGGFIRIVAVLPKGEIGQKSAKAEADTKRVPF